MSRRELKPKNELELKKVDLCFIKTGENKGRCIEPIIDDNIFCLTIDDKYISKKFMINYLKNYENWYRINDDVNNEITLDIITSVLCGKYKK